MTAAYTVGLLGGILLTIALELAARRREGRWPWSR